MAKFVTVQGTTSQIIHLFAQSAGATNGVGFTGLSFSASGLAAAYIRAGQSTMSAITLTGSGLNLGTYVSGAFLQVDSASMPGIYEFHVPNAAVTASGALPRVAFIVQGNASIAPIPFEIELNPANGIFTPILAATTHAGVTISNVQTCATVTRVLLADTVSTVARVLLADTVSTVARALLVDTATRVLLADTVSTVARVLLTDTVSTVARVLLVDTATLALNVNTATTVINSVTVGTYAAGMAPNTQVLATTGNKLITDGSGFITVGTNNDKSGYSLASGQIAIKKNATYPGFMFLMTDTSSHQPMTGLSVTGQYALTGGAFNAMASTGAEIASGWYKVDLAAAELNAPIVAIRLTAAGADDRCFTVFPQV